MSPDKKIKRLNSQLGELNLIKLVAGLGFEPRTFGL
jgi:hypothetical protein